MLETEDSIFVHIPKCGGMTLRQHLMGKPIHAKHDGVYALTPEQRRKKIRALTRDAQGWYQSFFQYCVEQKNPWLEQFGVPHLLEGSVFRAFLKRATIDPPTRQTLVIPAMRVSFDSFRYMRERGRGFWSFWHEFLCSDDPAKIEIAPDISFIRMGDPRFFPPFRENVSARLPLFWSAEMRNWLAADQEVARIVAAQTL